MIVVCEECGKRYRVDVEKMKATVGKANCHVCNHLIIFTKHEPTEPPLAGPGEEKPSALEPEAEKEAPKMPVFKTKGLGLTTKMLILFFVIPILLMTGASLLYLWQLNELSSLITKESSTLATQMAEDAISENAKSVAAQVGLYLQGHPDLKKEDFQKDAAFKGIAVQKVGKTGYSALHSVPDKDGIWHNWAHSNPKIVGMDMSKLKKPLGKAFPGFWKVFSTGKDGRESKGYYTWQDKDGNFRDKFMVCTPVAGTPYYIASTTYLDEFTMPVKTLEAHAEELRLKARNINIAILACTLILVGFVVSWYGYRVTRKIKYLTDVAERISVGDLDAEISLKSNDEIGELRDAISRMQDSIRLSIARLRQRR